ncbi:MAG: DNA polymerase III subunit beta [Planctomycetota bacterium]
MKITCDRSALTESFLLAASVAPTRSPNEVLQNVKITATDDGLVFTATNGEVGISTRLDEGVSVEQGGSILLPVTRTSALMRESNDEKLAIEAGPDGVIRLKGDRSKFTFPSVDADQFPSVSVFDADGWIECSASSMSMAIARTSYAAESESSRFALGGIKVESTDSGLVFVGTDGRRLANQSINANAMRHEIEGSTIIPTGALSVIQKSLSKAGGEACFRANANDVLVQAGASTVTCRLVEGRYPNWRQVIPSGLDEYHIASIPAGRLMQAVRQAAIVTSMESRAVLLKFSRGLLVVEGSTAELGDSKIETVIEYAGPDITLRVDHRYILDVCKVLNAEAVLTMQLESSRAPIVLSTDEAYQVVVMPMAER